MTINAVVEYLLLLHMQAFIVASTNENPRELMIAALVVVIAAFIIGIPLTIWYIIYRINNPDHYNHDDDDNDDHDHD